ncbi:hypothetical protein [Chitinophaga rhizophila]|uniref:GLPGLI family protein n=1 Tax=Chitinophaga rhizophila TaxID=2866212 RepID=A0ABS7GCL5_9BACT|nr:hypothetical protein [Chitinophaga rhizophila]MBW8685081.1 hypothetical protein [Chitinophaga rhizophila]
MRTLFLTVIMLVAALASQAQEIVKLYPDDTMKDSIIYQNKTSVLVINRVDLVNYMKGMDTLLQKECYSNNTYFRNIQFSHLTAQELESHFTSAQTFLADSNHTNLEYNTDKFVQFWTEDENILLPYIEDMLSSLLQDGRIKVIDRSSNKIVPQYTIFWEDIAGQGFKIYKLPSGRIIFKESNHYIEQYAGAGTAR